MTLVESCTSSLAASMVVTPDGVSRGTLGNFCRINKLADERGQGPTNRACLCDGLAVHDMKKTKSIGENIIKPPLEWIYSMGYTRFNDLFGHYDKDWVMKERQRLIDVGLYDVLAEDAEASEKENGPAPVWSGDTNDSSKTVTYEEAKVIREKRW